MNIIWLISAILGILVSVVPQFIFRSILFKTGSQPPKRIVQNFYCGAALKFVVFVLLFSLSLQLPQLQAMVFFLAYLSSDLVRWAYYWLSLPRTTMQ